MSFNKHIIVPENLGDRNLLGFFKGWYWDENVPSYITLDFRNVNFIAAWSVALFAAYGLWLKNVKNKHVNVLIDENTRAGHFLINIGLPDLFSNDDNSDKVYENNINICPIIQVKESKDISLHVKNTMDLLSIDDEEMSDAIRYILIELLRNVIQHSKSEIGGMCTSVYYPDREMAEIVVVDYGCGILKTLQERYPDITKDYKAVRFATQPHVSGTFAQGAYHSMLNNAGLGLFFIKEIVSLGAGGFFLGTGKALADYWGNIDGTPGKKYLESTKEGWHGTFAVIQLRKKMIFDFESILSKCRQIAAEVRKDPSELMLDFIDEIPDIPGITVINISEFDEDVESAAYIRDHTIIPKIKNDDIVILNFNGIKCATQSFVHACIYKIFRDVMGVANLISIAGATKATKEAIRAVVAYAVAESKKNL